MSRRNGRNGQMRTPANIGSVGVQRRCDWAMACAETKTQSQLALRFVLRGWSLGDSNP